MPISPKDIKIINITDVCNDIDLKLESSSWLNKTKKTNIDSSGENEVCWSFVFENLSKSEREEIARLYTEAGWRVEVKQDTHKENRFAIVLYTKEEHLK